MANACAHCVPFYRGLMLTLGGFPNHFSTFYFWDSLLQILELGLARKAGQPPWGTFFSLFPVAGIEMHITPWLLQGCWGSKLRPSGLYMHHLSSPGIANAVLCTLPVVENVSNTDTLTNRLEDIGCVWSHAFKSKKWSSWAWAWEIPKSSSGHLFSWRLFALSFAVEHESHPGISHLVKTPLPS